MTVFQTEDKASTKKSVGFFQIQKGYFKLLSNNNNKIKTGVCEIC